MSRINLAKDLVHCTVYALIADWRRYKASETEAEKTLNRQNLENSLEHLEENWDRLSTAVDEYVKGIYDVVVWERTEKKAKKKTAEGTN